MNAKKETVNEEQNHRGFHGRLPMLRRAVHLVKSIACESCDTQVLDIRSDKESQARAKHYGVQRVPAVVINGKLADCCSSGAVDATTLRSLGVGSPA